MSVTIDAAAGLTQSEPPALAWKADTEQHAIEKASEQLTDKRMKGETKMRSFLAVLAFVVFPTLVNAQPIHHHPQKAFYASPAEWPIHSGQVHWPNPDPTMTCHLHVEPKFPYGADLGNMPFEVPFTLKLFMCAARITSFDGETFSAITWDATGGTTVPVMRGDAMALKQWTGKVLIDPGAAAQRALLPPPRLEWHSVSGDRRPR